MIRISQACKSFGALVAVDGVSFEVAAGEAFGLLGPNGAGKTTTISMLTGLLRPDAGTVEIAGAADPGLPEVRRGIGVTPQTLAVYDDLTAEENLAFFGRLYGLRGALLRERVERSLVFSGLGERRRGRVGTFSGGMKRRLNIACSLMHDPPVLLMDEPTVGVDPQSRNQIFESIEQLRREGRTLLYTTHYMEEAQRLCDRVAIMDRGRILAMDTVSNLIAAHGGEAAVHAEFRVAPRDSTALPGELEGLSLRVRTATPTEAVARIAQAGGELATLHVEQPDLEAVFLNLTGRMLRD